MKKYILLLLLSCFAIQAQTLQNPTFGNVTLKNNITSLTATKVNVQDANGVINTIPKSDLINVIEKDNAPELPLIGEVGKIYVVKNLNKIYRWNGTFYQELAVTNITYQSVIDALTFTPENVANKSDSYSVSSTATYPNTKALVDGLGTKIAGTLTTNRIPKSFGAKSIGDSSINDNGTTVTTNLPIHANSFVKSIGSTNLLLASGSDIIQASLPISTATQTVLDLKANLASPALTGTPTAPTATAGTNTTQIATTAFVLANAGVGSLEFNATDLTVWSNGKGNEASNTVFGEEAMKSRTTGTSNSVYGRRALSLNTTGASNSAIGLNALGSVTTGSLNLGIGFASGQYISDGVSANSSPDSSVYLGNNTKSLANGQSNQIVIGYNAIGAGSNTVTLGNTSITNTILRGTVTTNGSFVKSSAPTTNILLAGGGDIAQNTAFNKNFGTTAGTVVQGGTLGTNAYSSTAYLPLSGGAVSGLIQAPSYKINNNGVVWEIINDENNFYIQETGVDSRLVIAKGSGNATFSSSVTATTLKLTSLPVFENNAAASSLAVGQFYRTSTGVLMVKF